MPLQPGDKLGPYEILALIGKGGMGEVWKARDPRLNRIVAIKRLKGEHTARFDQEAHAIAALNHPHICQIYDVGPDYLVMEYVEGKPVNGPLPVEEAVKLALQIAGALEEAHGRDILHRDLKPANILVTQKGSTKLLDFGLAKLMTESDSDATQTIEGTILGTAAYMAPEQAEGKPVDERSDIFSFGAVLYEMLSGNRAFRGNSTATVLSAVLRDDPAPLQAPAELQRVVAKCLAKQSQDRFPNIADLRVALEQIGTSKPADEKPSIAVLPFADMSVGKDQEYFSDGLAEEIINALVKIPGLKVIARTSAFAFKGQNTDIRKIAETLGVANILEGSVRRSGNRIRVTAQLITAADGSHLWSERYDRELTDVFAVQDEIAAAITGALQGKLIDKPAAPRLHQPNLPAYEALLKGRHQLHRFSPAAAARAKDYFEQAISLDPEYGEPHSALAEYYYYLGSWGLRPPTEVMPLAQAAGRRALELDPSDELARVVLGNVAMAYDYDWAEAKHQFRLAMASNQVTTEIRARRAVYFLVLGQQRDFVHEMEAVVEQDPIDATRRANFSLYLTWLAQYDKAITQARKALEIDESMTMAHLAIAHAYAFQGMFAEARGPAEQAHRLAQWNTLATGTLAGILSHLGEEERVKELLARLTGTAAGGMFAYHLLRSEFDAVAQDLEQELELRLPTGVLISLTPVMKPVRQTARWAKIAKMMNLPAGIQ